MRWLRLYETVLDDPKVQRLRPELFKAWINLLCVACRKDGVIPADMADLAFMLRTDDETALGWVRDLEAAGLIDRRDDFTRQPHDWDDYQFVSDNSTERVRAFRARKRASNGLDPEPGGGGNTPQHPRNVSGETLITPLESDSDTETESQSARASARETDRLDVLLLEKVVALFGRDNAKLGRMISGASRSRSGPDAYLKGVIEREASPAAVPAPAARTQVWIPVGSPAWNAWNSVAPRRALESKYHPGERGTYHDSEYPPAQGAVA